MVEEEVPEGETIMQSILEISENVVDPTVLGIIAATLVGLLVIAKVSDKAVKKYSKKHDGSEHAVKTANKVIDFVIYSIGLAIILGILGVPASAIGTFLGLLALGISFALRDIIANFISGILILITRPFKIGDQIAAEGEQGVVEDIRVRATDIKTFDGRRVIVPNSHLYNKSVVNNTAYESRRFHVIVGISYDDDIETAKELAKETLEEAETVEEQPEPQVLVDELGGSSVNLKLRGWTSTGRSNVLKAASEVTQLVKDKYDDEGIDIPYPIRTVYMEDE